MSKNLIARIAVAAVAIPVILWICYAGDSWLFGMVVVFAAFAISEFLSNETCRPNSFHFWFAVATVLAMLISSYVSNTGSTFFGSHFPGFPLILLVYFLVSGMLFGIGKRTPPELFASHVRLSWGVLYVGMLYPFVYLVGSSRDQLAGTHIQGGDWLLFLFGLLWIGDTAAMGIGKWIGRTKLAPAVSPNKTVEGFMGGIVGALAVAVLMFFWKFGEISFWHVLAIAIGCSIFGQLGDLVESMWKRSLGIKDSSAIIPGHGGVLDRFDSLLFAAPFVYYYKYFFLIR
jgi:phosphatidate cytidylyltransferase